MTTHDAETYLRVAINNESTSVRVLYTACPILSVIGVFRIDDDGEVDFTSLSPYDQTKIEEKCEQEYQKQRQQQIQQQQ